MGRFALVDFLSSPFEVQLEDLWALQKFVSQQRHIASNARSRGIQSKRKIRGRGMDYVETRKYFYGDDIRLMDWRVMARTHKPHVKVFETEKERPIFILLDLCPSMFFGTQVCLKSVLAANLVGLLAWTAKKHGDRVGGMLTSKMCRNLWLPHAHNQSLIGFLKAVCQGTRHYQDPMWNQWDLQNQNEQMIKSMRELNKALKPGALVLIVSDWYYQPDLIQPFLYEMKCHHDMILYHVSDLLELSIPQFGIYPISNGKVIKNMTLQTTSQMNEYTLFCQENIEQWSLMAEKVRVPFFQCSVQTDLPLLVRTSLLRSLRA